MLADKEEIRSRNDILEVIGAVVQLQRRGRNWVGLCPFHQEKTPSFNVDPVTQTFRCFGCDASGDVFSFVERHENMSFIEAVERLARRAGVEFERKGSNPVQRGERDALYEANSAAVTYFRHTLEKAPAAQEYLKRRMLLPETIEKFQIGYATEMWDGLVSYLRMRKVNTKTAADAGLIRLARTGDYVDAFRDRIMFPIHDDQNRVVGFGGRALGDDPAKYMNTGETPIFAKSRLLYALPFARRKIAEEGHTLLMEGYMDVITAHQAGFGNAVASLGTAFTSDHARKLARLAPTAVIAYDADEAGVKAALRAAAELERETVVARIVRLPQGEDPDSLIRSGHPELLARAIDSAITRVQLQIDLAQASADTSNEDGRQALLRRLIAILASVPTRAEREAYIEKIWRLHPLSSLGPGIAKEQLHRDAEEASGKVTRTTLAARQPFGRGSTDYRARFEPGQAGQSPSPEAPNAGRASPGVTRRLLAAEMLLIRAAATAEHRAHVLDLVEPDDLLHETDRALLAFVRDHQSELGEEEADLVQLLRSEPDCTFSEDAVQRLQESATALCNEPVDAAVLADAANALRQRREAVLRAELSRLLQSKGELTAEDRDRVRELTDLFARRRGSTQSS